MADLEKAKALSQKIVDAKKEAVRTGANKVTYEVYGRTRNEYWHSGRWNDRPSKIGAYLSI